MSNMETIKVQSVNLPKGGGAIQGIGESFQSNEFTGTASLSILIPTSSCREFEPKLSINYSSGGGQGVFGLGFGLSIPNISRKTSKGIPQYEDSDTFLLSNAEDLVPIKTEQQGNYQVTIYRPRIEGLFALIEHWQDTTKSDSHWRVIDKDNITSIFGKTQSTRIFNPEAPSQIFQWLLTTTFDTKGNHIVYEYKSENLDDIPDRIYEKNRNQIANKYIKKIKYGNYRPFSIDEDTQVQWHFEVVFDYGEYDPYSANPYKPVNKWRHRRDPFSTYQAGFEIRTHRLCRHVLMFHHFKELGDEPILVHGTRFNYQESPVVTLLESVDSIGYQYVDGSYKTKYLPPLKFKYTNFQAENQTFEELVEYSKDGKDRSLIGLNRSPNYQLIDLYGEGIPGILYNDAQTTLYWEAQGEATNSDTTKTVRYATPKSPSTFPINSQHQAINQQLMDLTGNGQLELLVNTPTYSGYYEANPDRSWQNFQTFPTFPNDFSNPDNYLVDVTGDGLSDLVLIDSDRIWVYPSQGGDGFGNPLIRPRPEELKLPWPRRSAANQLVQFSDILGSGRQHLIRISNGKVECWPSLGYGRFGKPIQLENAPNFTEDLDASRLFLADLDGSGTPDLIYAYPDRVEIFLNQSGNSFSNAIAIPLPHKWDRLNQISFADVRGNGTTCLVFSENHPQPRYWCYDFSRNQKPYLLNEVDNNLGAKSKITYSSSTKFYLKDKRDGLPWITNLPFPVQVVEKIESFDLISETKLISSYSYHHGYYDEVEREFRGFGMVERQDAETLPANAKNTDIPPILTKTWYHTGAYLQEEKLSKQYKREYFQGDEKAHLLPDSVLDYSHVQEYRPDTIDLREMHRALKGTVLRSEVYALDRSRIEANPYTVTETNFSVRLLQQRGENKYGVYFVHGLETLSYHYERNPQDPRIQHEFVLGITEYGNVKRSCTVTYGRRKNLALDIHPEQTQLYTTVHLSDFIEETERFRLIGIPYEQKVLEINQNGLKLPTSEYFALAEIQQQIDEALNHQIDYGAEFSSNNLQARLLSWEQSYFWNEPQNTSLPLGEVTVQALMHHHQQAVFSETWLEDVYKSRVESVLEEVGGYEGFSKEILNHQGGYFLDGNYWWNKGLVQHYLNQSGFYLPSESANDFAQENSQIKSLYAKNTTTYDSYYLLPVKTEAYLSDDASDRPIKHTTTVEIDYQTLKPWQLKDLNNVIHQAKFDPLGMVIATSIFKEAVGDRSRVGDGDLRNYKVSAEENLEPLAPSDRLKQIIDNRDLYLKNATTFFYYDISPWNTSKEQPPHHISLMRENHVSELELKADEINVIQVAVEYFDGFGRVIETKQLVESENNDNPNSKEVKPRWLVSGRTAYNNKGKPAEQYLPYFSDTALYENQQNISTEIPPTVIHYDPLLREIRVDTPKSFFSKVEFTPWETKHYDENDTVKDSEYYKAFQKQYESASKEEKKTLTNEKDALDKAAIFYNTPSITVLDSLGNAFLDIQNNLGGVSKNAFNSIVANTSITSETVWNTLLEKEYLSTDVESLGWVTDKFKPYEHDFKSNFIADLGDSYQLFAEKLLNLLKQNCLTEYHHHDIQGREIESIDPRLYYSNITEGTNYRNFQYQYEMTSDGKSPAMTDSADAGHSLSINNIFGNLLWHLSPRDFEQVITYDRLQRKEEIRVKGFKHDGTLASNNLVEKFVYGEQQPNVETHNLRGQLYQLWDQSGMIVNHEYNFQGEVIDTSRQFTKIYDHTSKTVDENADCGVDWGRDIELEKDRDGKDILYRSQFSFNALKHLKTETAPDGSVTTNTYNQGGLLDTVSVAFKDGTSQPIINSIIYDEKRQREKIVYGNGVTTTYTYEPTTLHLIKLHSTRSKQNKTGKERSTVLQDITYTYDAVGNITRLYNNTYKTKTVFHNNRKIEPLSDYTYDALYRLIRASGRQHKSIGSGTYRNNSKDEDFKQSKFIPLSDSNALEKYQESYTYDDAGNFIKTTHTATNSWVREQIVMPDSNRLKTVIKKNGIKDSYDLNYNRSGNQQQIGINNAVNLTWNCCENLVKAGIIERPDELDDCDYYNYDSAEMRTRKVSERMVNGGAITEKETKIYLGNYEIKRLHNQSANGEETTILERRTFRVMDDKTCVATIHYWKKDDRKREVDKPKTRSIRYQLDNHLGSVALEVDGDAQIISYEEYLPYGGTAFMAGKNQKEVKLKEYRYSGKERDDSTGLYYYGARYYAPWLGRWLKPDPAGTVDGLNLYGFVGGNPSNHVDNMGFAKKRKLNSDTVITFQNYQGVGERPQKKRRINNSQSHDVSHTGLEVNGNFQVPKNGPLKNHTIMNSLGQKTPKKTMNYLVGPGSQLKTDLIPPADILSALKTSVGLNNRIKTIRGIHGSSAKRTSLRLPVEIVSGHPDLKAYMIHARSNGKSKKAQAAIIAQAFALRDLNPTKPMVFAGDLNQNPAILQTMINNLHVPLARKNQLRVVSPDTHTHINRSTGTTKTLDFAITNIKEKNFMITSSEPSRRKNNPDHSRVTLRISKKAGVL